jgi:dolichol-phosphate mannosyltransferase
MPGKLPELSIFFPFWNEEENIETIVTKAIPQAEKIADKWEIIMIDDGSADRTLQIAKKLAEKNKNLLIYSHFPNRGYGAALKEGLTKSKYKYIVFNDGDGQFDFSEVGKFTKLIRNSDIVIGFRKKRNDTSIIKRLLLMNLLKIWNLIFFHFYYRDIDCGFKMFTRGALNKIGPLRSEGAMITTEILTKARKKKLKIKEVDITHYPRTRGKQSGANFPVIIRAVLESLQLWYDLHYGRA